jgi:predicted dehydrogenase
MVKLAVIGCGKVAEAMQLPGFAAVPQVSVVALVDINPKHLNRMGDLYGVKARYDDYHKMLKNEDVDAVSICTPNYLHARMAVDCCRAGKYVLVEKPPATSMAEIKRMKAAADEAGVFVMVEQYHRFVPVNELARSIIRSGALGKVLGFRGRLGSGDPTGWSPEGEWFFKKAEAFGGALADIGVHIIDTVRWVSGKEISRVQGFTAKLGTKGDVEDNAALTVQTKDGCVGIFEASWTQRPSFCGYQIYCQKGTLETVNYKYLKATTNDPKGEVNYDIPKESVLGGPWHYFINCVANKTKPFVDIEESGRSLAVILAGYRSAVTGKAVAVGG